MATGVHSRPTATVSHCTSHHSDLQRNRSPATCHRNSHWTQPHSPTALPTACPLCHCLQGVSNSPVHCTCQLQQLLPHPLANHCSPPATGLQRQAQIGPLTALPQLATPHLGLQPCESQPWPHLTPTVWTCNCSTNSSNSSASKPTVTGHPLRHIGTPLCTNLSLQPSA